MLQGCLLNLMTPKSQHTAHHTQSNRPVTTTTTADIYLHIQHIVGFLWKTISLLN